MTSLQFITAIPWNVHKGSGCYVGTRTLAEALGKLGTDVQMITPKIGALSYVGTRVLFNESLRWRRFHGAATIGIDADGYAIRRRRNSPPHIACIKGVLGDAVRFEKGASRVNLAFHAHLEKKHARRADLVVTISHYCADRLHELYGVKDAVVVPELIDLDAWRHLFRTNPAPPGRRKFTVLSVCRFYPRKRLDVLLRATHLLKMAIPEFEVRIVGNGPEYKYLRGICKELDLGPVVDWVGDVPIARLAQEYNRCDVFCLPSAQEGFGIVFLEAMAAGKPIVAARAAAVPEVVRSGILVEPGNHEELAEGIGRLYRDRDLRDALGSAGLRDVDRYEMNRVAPEFLLAISKVAPVFQAEVNWAKTR